MLRMPIRVALLFAMSFLAACVFLKGHYYGASFALVTSARQADGSIQKQRTDRDVIDEAAEPSDPAEQARREVKNRYYNTGGRDLLTLDPGMEMGGIGCGPAMPLLPTAFTPVIVLGTVIGAQPYLSEDRSSVYSEYMIRVEEFLKKDDGILPMAGENLVVDRGGGLLRLRSGHVIRYHMSGSNVARPLHTRERCILFLNRVDDGAYLHLGPGFLLRDGKAYLMAEREGPGILVGTIGGVSNDLSDEGEFIRAVQRAINNPPSTQFHSELEIRRQGNEK
jgi:hypothetical protein